MMCGLPDAEISMAQQVITELSSNSSEFDEEDDVSSLDPSLAGSSPTESSGSCATSVSGLPLSSDSKSVAESVAYC